MTKPRKKKPAKESQGGPPPAVEGVTWGDQTTIEVTSWAVTDLIPTGSVAVIEGRKETGKSTVLAALVAAWTGGPAFPNWANPDPGRVLVVATEDPWNKVWLPRVMMAGGNPSRVGALEIDVEGFGKRAPRIPSEIGLIEDRMLKSGANLLVLDPFDDLASDGIMLGTTEGARDFLLPLGMMCKKHNWVCVASRNIKKGTGHDIREAGYGNGKITNSARSLIRCDEHPNDDVQKVLFLAACNWASSKPCWSYTIQGKRGEVGYIAWHGPADLKVDTILAGKGDSEEREEGKECDQLLCSIIGNNWVPLADIRRAIAEAMISERMARRSKARLRIPHRRVAFTGNSRTEYGPPVKGWPDALVKLMVAPPPSDTPPSDDQEEQNETA